MDLAVGFDFDHTLGIDNQLERTAALALVDELAVEAGAQGKSDDRGEDIDAALHEYRSGHATIDVALSDYFARHVPGRGNYADVVAEFKSRVLSRVSEYVRPVDGIRELIAMLDDRSVPYAILTNGWSPLQEMKARAVEFHGPVYVSDVIGARKPSPEAFGYLRERLGMPAGSIWYVGDDPVVDVDGARRSGLFGVWLDWEGRAYPTGLEPPPLRVHSLKEVAAAIQGRMNGAANRPG